MKCIGCYYYRSLSQNKYMDDCCCHYLIDTGNMRKIPPSECYRHEGTPYLPKKREPQRWNQYKEFDRKGKRYLICNYQ